MPILRENKSLVDEYLAIRHWEVGQRSIAIEKTHLLLLLEYAAETAFHKLPFKQPSFTEHIKMPGKRRDGKEGIHSPEYQRKALSSTRHFFEWLKDEKEAYSTISTRWIKSLKIKPLPNKPKQKYYSLDEIIQIANTPVASLNEERIRAACAFLFLSGMRIGAFLTLPILAVNISELTVKQWPSLGVHTKLGKKATTRLLNVPEYQCLISIVTAWDSKVREIMSPAGMWFAPISPQTGKLDPHQKIGKCRQPGFRADLVSFLEKAGIEYKSAHKFRHKHIRYLRDRATTMRDLEAIAKNAMQTVETMLKYGELGERDALDIVHTLCNQAPTQISQKRNNEENTAILMAAAQLLNQLAEERNHGLR